MNYTKKNDYNQLRLLREGVYKVSIKTRFITSYLSAIFITITTIVMIIAFIFYITVGKVPNISDTYKLLTMQRSLTYEEEQAYFKLNELVKKSPEKMNPTNNDELFRIIKLIEKNGLDIVLKKNNDFTYYSQDLVEKSLRAHTIEYELNNFKPIGTLDNNGRLYHYLKQDFLFIDGSRGSFIILKRESNLLEFFTKWGIGIVLLIISLAILLAIYINHHLSRTIIKPLEVLRKTTQNIESTTTLDVNLDKMPQKESTKEVYDLQLSFKKMWIKLYEAERLRLKYENNRKELVANISHDLKTPITSIIGYVEGIQDGIANTPEKKASYLKTIHQKATSLNQLIEELFLYSKLELDKQLFKFEKISFLLFIQKIVSDYQEMYPEVEILLNHNLLKENQIFLDSIQAERAVINIIENSLKFKDSTKNKLIINIDVVKTSTNYQLSIRDNGIGIPSINIDKVANKFFRSDDARTPSVPGSGLGLSIVKEIMIKHQGKLDIKSTLNGGTEIRLYFPRIKEISI